MPLSAASSAFSPSPTLFFPAPHSARACLQAPHQSAELRGIHPAIAISVGIREVCLTAGSARIFRGVEGSIAIGVQDREQSDLGRLGVDRCAGGPAARVTGQKAEAHTESQTCRRKTHG